MPEEVALCLYRIAQEALNNVLKHSGASDAVVTLSKSIDGYDMIVKDAGKGFDTEAYSQGLGLISMRERLRPLQGHLSVNSICNLGTEIVIRIPRKDAPGPGSPRYDG